ncbi:MAG: TIGR00341 family protein [Nitrospiraceae bacterium]|nr:MAG: TIGR00341 family protein [Nitrospiraceae bacterium]
MVLNVSEISESLYTLPIIIMALRFIEIYHQKGKADDIDFLLKDLPILDTWHFHLAENNESVTKVLLKTVNTETVLDTLQSFFSEDKTLRFVLLPVEATIPRPSEPDIEEKKEVQKSPQRISVEELYQKLFAVSSINQKYIVMVVIASFVAAIGLLKNDAAVIIGSMVIAPLLSPNMALSLATTLADFRLAKNSIVTNIIGLVLGLLIGIFLGVVMNVDPNIPQIASRSDVSYFYLFLALAAGVAGAYSITTGVAEALVGVMVAVALLPPLVAAGLLFGGGFWINGAEAFLLCLVNVVCINLSGVVTFLLQGIQPNEWWKAEQAKRAVKAAVSVWIALLCILAVFIFFAQKIK